jgi:biotin synthase
MNKPNSTALAEAAFYQSLAEQSLAGVELNPELCLRILTDPTLDLLPLVNAAFQVRKTHWGMRVQLHILNNAQNGHCSEDCAYCVQAKSSKAGIHEYPLKPDAEIPAEAQRAYEAGAHRYCMMFSGRGPSSSRVEHLARLVREIKALYPIEVCVSAGLLDEAKAKVLAEAGLDRLNHNLNTSRALYSKICTTHTYDDRLHTLNSAKAAGLQLCSGLIAGMGEKPEELIEIAKTLRALGVQSIPVNFLLPFEGNVLRYPEGLNPQYCLRILCLFRFLNPSAELRATAGREFHMRSLEVMCLYVANSIFLDGYLNGRGHLRRQTYQMMLDVGFIIESEHKLEELLCEDEPPVPAAPAPAQNPCASATFKTPAELRPRAIPR